MMHPFSWCILDVAVNLQQPHLMLQVAIATLDTVPLRLPPATTTAVTATQAQLLAVLQMWAAIRPTPASVSNCLSHGAALTALPKS